MTPVLLVDDEKDLSDLLSIQLTRAGFEVHCADAVSTAQALSQQAQFDVLVTDLNLPDGDGLDVARAVGIPIRLAPTASGGDDDKQRLIGEGFAAVLLKPVTSSRLVAAINAALSNGS